MKLLDRLLSFIPRKATESDTSYNIEARNQRLDVPIFSERQMASDLNSMFKRLASRRGLDGRDL